MQTGLVERFVADGFVKLPQAVRPDVAAAAAEVLWERSGVRRDEPSTWDKPVVWLGGLVDPPFVEAVNAPVLLDAFDALVGPGRWVPRQSMGSFPLRFPHAEEPNDAGWHIEGSYAVAGTPGYWTNRHSRDRVLLMLFLFSDVDEDDAPTRIRVGSHWDVPAVLEPFGDAGAPGMQLGPLVDAASAHRPVALATGLAGDVFVCHPFLVHAAQPHHGTRPRFLAQPALLPLAQYAARPFEHDGSDVPPAARMIRDAPL